MEILTTIALLTVLISIFLYFYDRYYLSYWKNRNIPSIRTFKKFIDIIFFKICPAIVFDEIYNDPETKDEAVVGINVFHRPGVVIKDPELIKKVLIKDFDNFKDRYATCDPHKDLLGSNTMFFKKNPEWKVVRTHLTQVFSSGKIKQMFSLMNDIGIELEKHISTETKKSGNKKEMDIKKVAQLYTIDVIASIAFGINAHSMTDPEADFLKHGKEVFHFNRRRSVEFSILFFLPDIISCFNIKMMTKGATDFLIKSFRYIMNEREKNNIQRNDLIEALIALKKQQLKNETDPKKILDEIVLIAQAASYFVAGQETSSSAMSFALYELARHPQVQKRLRQEIKEVFEKNNGELTYDIVQEMEYLNMVVQEILRLYPVLPFLDRIYYHSDKKEYSLKPFSKGSISNGTPVYIPVYSIQRDEKYFENPNEFIPERFSPDNKDKIKPYSLMPFGVGPRNCIGERFGLLQTKLGLIYFLKNHIVEHSEKTVKNAELESKALLLNLKSGQVFLNVVNDKVL